VQGLDDPPRALVEVEPATGDGSIITDARYAPREVFLPLHYTAPDTPTLRATMRQLATLLDFKTGLPVTLEVAHADGTRRYINGLASQPYASGLPQAEGALHRTIGLTLRCPDPFFYERETSAGWTLGGDSVPFLGDPFLPIGLDNSQVLGAAVIANDGDAHAYPIWTLTGPCDQVTVTTGATTWTVPDGLTDTETLVINARRGVKTCEINGVSAWGRLSPGSVISTLAPGDNLLDVEAVAATADTTITVAWAERWLTAW
jgi:phage-related protein